MRLRGLALSFLLGLSLSIMAQTNPKPEERGLMGWVHSAWKTVQKEGKPAAEKLAKEFPQRFRNVKSTMDGLSKKVRDTIDAMNLEQKRATLEQIWRVRKSLDMMALLSPEMLQELTGLDTSTLRSMEDQAVKMTDMVTLKIRTSRL